MMHALIPSLMKDYVELLLSEPRFFDLSPEKKASLIMTGIGSKALGQALLAIPDEDQFLEDFRKTLSFLRNEEKSSSELVKSLAQYLLSEFFNVFDHLEKTFYNLPYPSQQKTLRELLPTNTIFFEQLRSILERASLQELGDSIIDFLQKIMKSPLILIQSPIECSPSLKTEIRKTISPNYPHSFALFSINPLLIGGIRIFIDGNVEDHSWFSKIQNLHQYAS